MAQTEIPDADVTLKIITFSVGQLREYAALIIPAGSAKVPVHLYVGGFGIDNQVNPIVLAMDSKMQDKFIFALPALRGQSLAITINDIVYTSPVSGGNHCDAFDGAADDVISLLNVIETMEPTADVHRTSVRGGSRGSTVAFLVAERDKRVKGAVGVAGPMNVLELTSANENDRTYQCQFLSALVNENESQKAVRLKMIASSPIFFANLLPKAQLHLAQNDEIVPFTQGKQLQAEMTKFGIADSLELYIYEGRTHQNIATDNQQLNDRINKFLEEI